MTGVDHLNLKISLILSILLFVSKFHALLS